jgi:hypothetical protein
MEIYSQSDRAFNYARRTFEQTEVRELVTGKSARRVNYGDISCQQARPSEIVAGLTLVLFSTHISS